MKRTLLLSVCLTLCTFFTPISAYQEIAVDQELMSKNPRLKDQKVRKLRLDNGVAVYLVSDPEAKSSGAAFSMKVGSWDDPKKYPGTAHFVEHLLFMGSHTYPDEEAYMTAINNAGGACNAFTASTQTVYGFSSDNPHFKEIFSMFAHMFIDPLFNPDSIAREYKAVEQEYQISLTSDGWRQMQVIKDIANPEHPHTAFNCGNKETLGSIPVDVAIAWYKEHYDPALGSLVLASPLSLDEMTAMADELFGQLQPLEKSPKECGSNTKERLLLDHKLPLMVHIEPYNKEAKSFTLVWELPPSFSSLTDEGQRACFVVLKHLMSAGHENSLYAQLKNDNLINGLSISNFSLSKNMHLFCIDFHLTDEGIGKTSEIEQKTSAFLNQLATTNVPSYVTDEISKVWESSINSRPRQQPFQLCMGVANALTNEDITTYPKKHFKLAPFSQEAFKAFVNLLDFNKALKIGLIPSEKSKVSMDKKEFWYQVDYAAIQEPSVPALENAPVFTLFENPNPYMPVSMEPLDSSFASEEVDPKVLLNSARAKLVYWKDTTFLLPKLSMHMNLQSPEMDLDVTSCAYLDMFSYIAAEKLIPINAKGDTAGLNIGVSTGMGEINISLSGYQDKSERFFSDALDILGDFEVSDQLFESKKELLKANFEGAKTTPAYQYAAKKIANLTSSFNFPSSEYLNAIDAMDKDRYVAFIKKAFASRVTKTVVAGPLSQEDAQSLYLCFESHPLFKRDPAKHVGSIDQVYTLALDGNKPPQKVHISREHKGSSALLMVQDEGFSFEQLASNYILNYSISTQFHEVLRTKQQTGYVATSFPKLTNNDLISVNFLVQSTTHTSEELLARYELFLEEYLRKLDEDITAEKFETFKTTLISQINTPPETLDQKSALIFDALCNYEADFKRREKLLKATKALTYDAFINWTKSLLGRSNNKRLAVLVDGCDNEFCYEDKACDTLHFFEKPMADGIETVQQISEAESISDYEEASDGTDSAA